MPIVTSAGAVSTSADAVDPTDVCYIGGIAVKKSNGAMYVTSGLTTAQLAALSANGSLPAKTSVGTRILTPVHQGGFAQAGANYTWGLHVALPNEFVALRLVLGNGLAVPVTGVTACASSGATAADHVNNSGTWTNATFAGASSITLPAGSSADPSITLSDWIYLPSVSYSSGNAKSMAYVRCMTPLANANAPLMGLGVSISGWANKADGMLWAWTFQSGDFVTTPAGMTSSADPSAAPIIGVQYLTKTGVVVSNAFFGDSEVGSYLATIPGDSWCSTATNAAGQKAVCANLGYTGQTTTAILTRAQRYIPLLKPSIAWFPVGSPNDGTPTASVVNTEYANLMTFVALCRANGCIPIGYTQLPRTTDATNTTSAYTSGQDDLRKTINNNLLASGLIVVDTAAVVSDTTALGTASKWLSASITVEGLHPNDAGNALLVVPTSATVVALSL